MRRSRHKSFESGEAQVSDGKIARRVHILDENGETGEALYTLEQQADGSPKIVGCVLLKAGTAVSSHSRQYQPLARPDQQPHHDGDVERVPGEPVHERGGVGT